MSFGIVRADNCMFRKSILMLKCMWQMIEVRECRRTCRPHHQIESVLHRQRVL